MKLKSLIRAPAFVSLMLAYSLNELAWSVGTLALSILVYKRTGSALGSTGFFLLSQVVPGFVAPLVVPRLERFAPRRLRVRAARPDRAADAGHPPEPGSGRRPPRPARTRRARRSCPLPPVHARTTRRNRSARTGTARLHGHARQKSAAADPGAVRQATSRTNVIRPIQPGRPPVRQPSEPRRRVGAAPVPAAGRSIVLGSGWAPRGLSAAGRPDDDHALGNRVGEFPIPIPPTARQGQE